jgi:hypothetical protein
MTDIEVLLLVVVVAAISGWIGWRTASRFHENIFSEMLDRLGVSNDEMAKMARDMAKDIGMPLTKEEEDAFEEKIHIRIEQDGAQLFAYRKDTGEFIGQGKDKDTLLARLTEQFPKGANLILTDEDGAEFVK